MIQILSKTKLKINIPKKKIKEIKKNFSELRHKSSKEEIDNYRKSFHDMKKYKYFSPAEIKEIEKKLTKLEAKLQFKKFYDDDDYNDEHKKNKNH